MGYTFPETFDDPESLERQKETFFAILQGDQRESRVPWDEAAAAAASGSGSGVGGAGGWGWADEEIQIPKHHLPAPQTDDLLPSESHSSYPFGRPYLAASGQHPRASTLKHTPRTWLAEAKAWNGITSDRTKSATATTAQASAVGAAGDGTHPSKSSLDTLPAYLSSKQAIDRIPHLTTTSWPFSPAGPGQFNWKSILSSRQADIAAQGALRDQMSLLERETWCELALDQLLPRGEREVDPLSPSARRAGKRLRLDAEQSSQQQQHQSSAAFFTQVEADLGAFEAQLRATYGDDGEDEGDGAGDEDEDGADSDGDAADDDEDITPKPHDDATAGAAEDGEDDEDAATGRVAEMKASRHLKRLLAASMARRPQSSTTYTTPTPAQDTEELRNLLLSLRLKKGVRAAGGAAHGPGSSQSVFLRRAAAAAAAQVGQ